MKDVHIEVFWPVKKSHRDQLPDLHRLLILVEKCCLQLRITSANIAVQTVLAEASDKSDATTDSSSGSNLRGPYLH